MYLTGARFPTWVDDKPRTYDILLWKLSSDGKSVLDSGTIIHRGHGSEGTKILKINGWYYIFYCEHQDGDFKNDRIQMAMRSKNLYGPYEHHRLLQQRKAEERSPGQGGLVDTKEGTWWFIHQQGNSNYLGRQAVLEPVTWIEGWPIIGKVMPDTVGSMVWEHEKPVKGYPVTHPQSSDEFSAPALSPQWEWNHAPRNDKWSLTEREGFLRLYASVPARKGLWGACNTLTQRCMGTEPAYASAKIEIKGMVDGQEAGLCIMGGNAWRLQVYQENGKRVLCTKTDGGNNDFNVIAEDNIGTTIWMRVLTNHDNFRFQYSMDGKSFVNIGPSFTPYFNNWRGVQAGLFSFNEKENAGYIDVDWFEYDYR
jgi:beta-xylosidase